ncbi:MAG: hydroxymethylbilane synthase [Cyclobacteriaceae bacterium]
MTSHRKLRIGTRESELALFQARVVQQHFTAMGIETDLIEITSEGDIDLETPLYEMGIQGIFTKTLDIALLQNRIDLAVHSAKDVPTRLARGLMIAAIPERGPSADALVLPRHTDAIDLTEDCTIATSSLRRKTQWLHRYAHHRTEPLRGNIQTRLNKLDDTGWQGAVFALAALQRLNISTHKIKPLDWMLPAPAQGAIAVVCRGSDSTVRETCGAIDHWPSSLSIGVERDFLAALQGGCAVPIGAYAEIRSGKLHFRGNVMSMDALQELEVEMDFDVDQARDAGRLAAGEMVAKGAESIIKTFRAA